MAELKKMKFLSLILCFSAFVVCSIQKPIDNRTIYRMADDSSQLQRNETETSSPNPTEPGAELPEESNDTVSRTAHSRMRQFQAETTVSPLTSTEYDYWWYFTTPRRPRFSYRDFPGKPGVATWKEISPSVVREGKKNRKASEPTAAGVLSGSIASCEPSIAAILSAILVFGYNIVLTLH